ncbi:MAG TPA: prephenate dehydrogenase/arogenate dehydrogenase family protein [Planctomycetaceae bacterium]|nr:prephenate dehydrogenase/arogenate dehydrogenase family protein [Planctomycetaceae bacterium]
MSRQSHPSPPFATSVAVIGVGLIGGSIAAGLKRLGFTGPVIGAGRNRARLEQAHARGLIDSIADDVATAASSADLIVVSTPVDRIVEDVRAAADACHPGTLLTDAGSVKQHICRSLENALPGGATFIGSHPLAGSEKRGFEHADAHLFEGRVCVVTPDGRTPPEALHRLKAFWRFLGMSVLEMPADEHDAALARTSHLPHVAAAALADAVPPDLYELAGTGFRDTTRIAAGSPDLWVGILLDNAESLLAALDAYAERFQDFREAVARRDAARLRQLLGVAKQNRDALGR